jgi:outer membrane protein TolC
VIRTLIVKNELTRDIRVACLRELQARQLLETAAVASKNAIQRRDAVKLQFDEGVLTKFDVLRSETEVADAAQKVIIAEDRLRVAHANISRLIEVPESSVPYITTATLITDVPDSAIVVPLAMAQRPELGLARLQIRAEELGVRLAGNSERPALSVGLQSYVLSNPSTFEPGRPVNAASVQLRIPIIDRGESKARTQTSEARLEASKWTLKSIEESIRFQVSEAMSNLREAKERVEVATRALKQAEEQYSIGQQRFEGGLTHGALSPMLELSDSQTVLTQAKNNLTNARIDVLIAQAEIDYVMGGTK